MTAARRRARLVVAAFALALAPSPGIAIVRPAPAAAAATSRAARPVTWLAAGDSYSSGEGLPHATGSCARPAPGSGSETWAQVAYDRLHGAVAGLTAPNLVACTGATTGQMLGAPDALGTPEWRPAMGRFDLVTFTFGGDDIGFASILEQCLGLSRLVATVESAASGAGIPHYVAPLPSDPGHTCPAASIVRARIARLASTYRTLLTQVADQVVVPGGNVVVLGYPELVELPKLWRWWEQRIGSCWGIGTADATELRGLAGDLNATIGAAVAAVDRQAPHGVHLRFVDVNTANGSTPASDPNLFEPATGTRHNLCSADPWLNEETAIDYGSGSFHPKQQGLDHEGALAAGVIEHLDWAHLAPPAPTWQAQGRVPGLSFGPPGNVVSCAGASFCLALSPAIGAAEWDGQHWAAVPGPPGPPGYWSALSCASSTMCMAVASTYTVPTNAAGTASGTSPATSWAARWNGSRWLAPVALDTYQAGPAGDYGVVQAVSCPTPTFCMAVGGHVGSLVWDGSTWTAHAVQATGVDGGTALSCASPNFCMATPAGGTPVTWDGHRWAAAAGGVAPGAAWPGQVACTSASLCLAVTTGGSLDRWDGSAWHATGRRTGVGEANVACTAPSWCLAVDVRTGTASVYVGGSWSAPSSVYTPAIDQVISVSCGAPDRCMLLAGNDAFVLGPAG